MNTFRWTSTLLLSLTLVFTMVWTGPLVAQDQAPEQLLREKIDSVMNIIGDTVYTNAQQVQQVQNRLIQTIEPLFGFREMTIRSLGHHARSLNSEQIDRLTDLFRRLLEKIYVERLTTQLESSKDGFKVDSVSITETDRREQYAKISSVLTVNKGSETKNFHINYKMVNRGEWKIYDIEIENLSIISNYRDQFTETLTNSSFDQLVDMIQKMVQKKKQSLPTDEPSQTGKSESTAAEQ